MDKFKDIRPYRDDEIRPVLNQLISDSDFLDSIARFYHPRMTDMMPGLMRAAASRKLRKQVRGVNDVRSMQDVIAGYMDKMVHDTTTRLDNSGLESLDSSRHYLFISNHRDITMDPAFVNYMLYHGGHDTLQIAIGDNLLKKPFVTDLMRLNKSFIVRRSLKGRQLLKSLALLSEYIHHCIETGQNVWIAQREGRAKDGIDRTDPALLKMLAMGMRDLSFREALNNLHIVPVSLSYEYDPCDVLKAEELYQKDKSGSYEKTDDSDIHSIVTGMVGFKGRVHIAFGTEMAISSDDPDRIAADIDQQIINNYEVTDINYLALERLGREGLVPPQQLAGIEMNREISGDNRRKFDARLSAIESRLVPYVLFNYANPLLSRYGMNSLRDDV